MLDWLQNTWNTLFGLISQTVIIAFPLINTILVIMAGCFGSMLFGKIKPPYREVMLKALGIIIILMGFSEMWDGFFVLQTGQIETTGTILVVFSLLLGYVFGDALALDRNLGKLGVWIYGSFNKDASSAQAKGKKAPAAQAPSIDPKTNVPGAEGFVLASVVCAFSAPTVRCAIESQMSEDALPLLIKLGFDIVVIFVLAAMYGSNVTFAAVPMLAVEGLLILIAKLWGDVLTPTLINQLTLVGAVILIATGISLGLGKKLRTANLIPAFFIPAVYGLIMMLVEKFTQAE